MVAVELHGIELVGASIHVDDHGGGVDANTTCTGCIGELVNDVDDFRIHRNLDIERGPAKFPFHAGKNPAWLAILDGESLAEMRPHHLDPGATIVGDEWVKRSG